MPSKKRKQGSHNRFFRSKWFFSILVVVLVLLGYSYGNALYKDYTIKQDIEKLKLNIQSLETEKFESLELLDYVMSDDFVEREARRSLNLQEPGEEVYMVAATATTRIAVASVEPEKNSRLKNPVKWWYYFIQKNNNN